MGIFNEDSGEVSKLTIAYIVTIIGNLLFTIIASGLTKSLIKSIVVSAAITVATLLVNYGKSKFGMYDEGRNANMLYSVYIIQIIITFIVVLFGLYLIR